MAGNTFVTQSLLVGSTKSAYESQVTQALVVGSVTLSYKTQVTQAFVGISTWTAYKTQVTQVCLVVWVKTGPAVIDSFIASGTSTCVARGITLSWSIEGNYPIVITDDLGNVVFAGISSTGSIVVYPARTTTYTLTVNDAINSPVTAQVTANISINMIVLSQPNRTPVYFSAGASFPEGVYLITCCGGAFSWDYGVHLGVNSNNRRVLSSQAFKVFGPQATVIDAPGSYPGYGSVAASNAISQGQTQIFNHRGGPIGIYLNLDDYSEIVETFEPPAFSIAGPAPKVQLAANTTPVIAGDSVALVWTVTGSTDASGITIDHGVGIVSPTGSASVSPTVTTRYTLVALYQGLMVTTYADVLIGVPSVPVATLTPACDGTIAFAWTAPTFTTQTLIERSATGGGVGFTQVGSVAVGTLTFTDTPPIPGQTYFYRLRNTDGVNFSGYTVDHQSATRLPPVPVTDLTVTSLVGVPVLRWTASPLATSYQVKRATLSLDEGTVYTMPVTTPGQAFAVRDTQATNGVMTYYVVVGVNSCGPGVISDEVSIVPGFKEDYSGGLI